MRNVPRIEEMRKAVANAYPGEGWKKRVTYMHSNQIVAIYFSLASRGAFDDPDIVQTQIQMRKDDILPKAEEKPQDIQLSIFDILKEN